MKISLLIRFLVFAMLIIGFLISAIIVRGNPELVFTFIIVSLAIFLVGLIYYYLSVIKPLVVFENKLKSLAEGKIRDINSYQSGSEIAEMEKHLDSHVQRLSEVIDVVNELSEGNLAEKFELLCSGDEVGQSIVKLQESIVRSNEEAVRRRSSDEQENWASQGLAHFGSLLREYDQDVERLSQIFINELVKYIDVEIGGLFLIKIDDHGKVAYTLKGSYAFDRVKNIEKTFIPGDGLVGRCALEKKSIILTDVPADYIRIRSGLGEDKPSTIMLVPVISDNKVLGIIEMASFIQIPEYKIRFVESLADSIAPAIAKALYSGCP